MKVYAILKSTEDWSNCYYEGDMPSKSAEIVDFAITEEDAWQKASKSQQEADKTNQSYQLDVRFEIQEITTISKPVIKYLWDNRDKQ